MTEIFNIGTMVAVVAFFLKDLFYGHKKNTATISELASATTTAVVTLAKLETTIGSLHGTVHSLEIAVATMSSNFVTKSDHSESIRSLHKRIEEFKEKVLTGEWRAIKL
jgi:hypothetical protein